MRGDDRVRFCKHCSLNVYNLSAMTRAQAEAHVNNHEGRLCASFYRRQDGTIVTADCGRIRAAARKVWRGVGAAVAAVACVALAPLGWASLSKEDETTPTMVEPPMCRVAGDVSVAPAPPPPRALQLLGKIRAACQAPAVRGEVAVGGISAPPPATQPTTAPATQPAE